MLKLGIIGFGEAGYYLTKEFVENSVQIFAYDSVVTGGGDRAALVTRRAAENGVTLVNSLEELFDCSEVIFCLTSAGSALPIAKSIEPLLREEQVYADLNSTSPMTKEKIADALASAKGEFIEAAVMNAVPAKKTKVPICVCGKHAEAFAQRLNACGMNVTAMGEKIGSASALKMLKSVLSKGIIALITETVFCTEKYGLTEKVLSSLKNTIDMMTYEKFCHYVVTQASVHHERLSKEMDEVLETLDGLGENAIMTRATREKFLWMTKKGFRDHFKERPATYQEVIAVKRQIEQKQ